MQKYWIAPISSPYHTFQLQARPTAGNDQVVLLAEPLLSIAVLESWHTSDFRIEKSSLKGPTDFRAVAYDVIPGGSSEAELQY